MAQSHPPQGRRVEKRGPTDRLVLGILDNALDYLLSAAEHARSDSNRDWKYALVHLVAAVELLLKARLDKEHWSLVFADVDSASEAKVRSGDFKSVDLQSARARLEKIASVTIGQDDVRHLEELRKLRNRVQHFAIDVQLGQIKSLLARGINFFVDFMRSNLPEEVEGHEEALETIHEHLREFDDFVQTRLKAIAEELQQAVDLLDCPRCLQETLALGVGDPHCAFCGFGMAAQEFKEYLGEGAVDGDCLSCEEGALSFVLVHNEFGYDQCVSCGTKQTTCLKCFYRSLGVNPVCPRCGYSG